MGVQVGWFARLVMDRVDLTHGAVAVKPEPMRQVIEKIVKHQDEKNIQRDVPGRLRLCGNAKWQNQYKEYPVAIHTHFLCGSYHRGVFFFTPFLLVTLGVYIAHM